MKCLAQLNVSWELKLMKSFEKNRVEVGALSWVAYSALSSVCDNSRKKILGFVGPACFITECTYTFACFCT